MGKENDAIISYLEDDARFADLFNHFYFGGKQVVKPEELKEASEVYTRASGKTNRGGQRFRDIKRRLESGACLKVLAVEAQEDVNYYMPWRIMDYDYLEYNRQIKKIQKKNQAAEDELKRRRKTGAPDSGTTQSTSIYANAGERLGKFRRGDRIAPVYTLCLYHGKEKWDGPRSLKDIMDFGAAGSGKERRQWEDCFADYPMRLVCVNEISDCTGFQTSLGLLFQLLGLRGDRDALKKLLARDAAY